MTPQQKGFAIEDPLLERFDFEPLRSNFGAIDGIRKGLVGGQINVVEVAPVNVVQIKRVSWEGGRTDVNPEQIMEKAADALRIVHRKLDSRWKRSKKEFNGSKRSEGADKFGFELPENWTDERVKLTVIVNVDARPPPNKSAIEAALHEKAKARFGEGAEVKIVWGTVAPDDSVPAPTMSVE
jgi:hypothetical protein